MLNFALLVRKVRGAFSHNQERRGPVSTNDMRKLFAVMNTRLPVDGNWVQGGPVTYEMREGSAPLSPDAIRERLAEEGIAHIEGSERMSEDELNQEIASLVQWRQDCLAAGLPFYPPNVCIKCLRQHLEQSTECPS